MRRRHVHPPRQIHATPPSEAGMAKANMSTAVSRDDATSTASYSAYIASQNFGTRSTPLSYNDTPTGKKYTDYMPLVSNTVCMSMR
ncbi:hypothetical protein BHE74_00012759 [Ensete ventricosum]|nr:hypothetical protein BHE74_00012759 [Ensete ventricosum]RZS02860.1 hypothetical protein BHM03_00032968 [Ensete ventricosum]